MTNYTVIFLSETGAWETLLTGLTYEGAQRHAKMYARLFHTETQIWLDGAIRIDIE